MVPKAQYLVFLLILDIILECNINCIYFGKYVKFWRRHHIDPNVLTDDRMFLCLSPNILCILIIDSNRSSVR